MSFISEVERALIDQAVQEGMISRQPMKTGPKRGVKALDRKADIEAGIAAGWSLRDIAKSLCLSTQTISNNCRDLGIEVPRRPRRANEGDYASLKKEAAAKKKVQKVSDRRRFKTTPVPMGDPSTMANPGANGSIFPQRVFDPNDNETLLKDGSNQSKIGGDVLVGWLKGARIYTLTLEERATCPKSCKHWLSCYGNSMNHARRWRHGPQLMDQLREEVPDLCRKFGKILIRLHILGDFWSNDYVEFWHELLMSNTDLHIFGFTAHKQGTEIGDAIALIRDKYPHRFMIRHSNMTGPWGSFTIDFPTEEKQIGDAVVCPEQRDAMSGARKGRHCGNCGVCWSSDAPVAFVTH